MKVTWILWPTPMPGLRSLGEMTTFKTAMEITIIAPSEVHLAWAKPSKCHALTIAEKEDPPNIHWSSARISKNGEMKKFRKLCMVVIGAEDPGWVVIREIGHHYMKIRDPATVAMIKTEMVGSGFSRIPNSLASITFILYMPQNKIES